MQNVTPHMASMVGQVLEETTSMISESLILRHLAKYGSVNLEEASFYQNLAGQVITEAADEFIPEEVETEDPMDALELYDAAGNCYLFDPNTGSLTPVDAPADQEPAPDSVPPVEADPTIPEEPAPVAESTVIAPAANADASAPAATAPAASAPIEESTVVAPTSNSSTVARILANIKA